MNDIQNIMKADQPTFSIYELATLMRNCHSPQEIQSFVSNLRIEFDYYSISDQGFLLAMIGMAIMNQSDDRGKDQCDILVPLLLRGLNRTRQNESRVIEDK